MDPFVNKFMVPAGKMKQFDFGDVTHYVDNESVKRISDAYNNPQHKRNSRSLSHRNNNSNFYARMKGSTVKNTDGSLDRSIKKLDSGHIHHVSNTNFGGFYEVLTI